LPISNVDIVAVNNSFPENIFQQDHFSIPDLEKIAGINCGVERHCGNKSAGTHVEVPVKITVRSFHLFQINPPPPKIRERWM
jgi:hypothetical protein